MYAGFITHRHAIKRLGVHQRIDMAAYRMVRHYFAPGSFPPIRQIIHFEGPNGPDGLKVKSPGSADPDHFYNPIEDSGELPKHLANHYDQLVAALVEHDLVRAGFEASWLAHFVADGLTPAHHSLITAEVERLAGETSIKGKFKYVATGEGALKKNWAIWGGKGLFATHHNFEIGIATNLIGRPLHVKLSQVKLAHARRVGYMAYFKEEARAIAKLDLYNQFQKKGWTAKLASSIKKKLLPRTVQTVGIIWLLAYLEAGLTSAKLPAQAAHAH